MAPNIDATAARKATGKSVANYTGKHRALSHIPQHAAPHTPAQKARAKALPLLGPEGAAASAAEKATRKPKPKPKPKPTKTQLARKGVQQYAPVRGPHNTVVTYRHILAVEFCLGLLILLSSKVKGQDAGSTAFYGAPNVLTRAAALCIVWVVLFGVTSAGRGAARFSAALGGLITLALLMSTRDTNIITRVFNTYVKFTAPETGVGSTGGNTTTTPPVLQHGAGGAQ